MHDFFFQISPAKTVLVQACLQMVSVCYKTDYTQVQYQLISNWNIEWIAVSRVIKDMMNYSQNTKNYSS